MSRVHSGPAVGDHCLLSNGSWSGMECSLVSTSTDGGDYFGPIRRNFELSEPPGGCAPGLAADPLDLASGVLYFSNPASRTARERMVVRRSTGQQGLTWTNDSDSVLVYGGPAAYSCLAPLYPVSASNSHRVGLLYERDAPGCTGPSCAIYYTAIPTPNPKKKATKKTDDDDDRIDGSQAAAQTIPLDQLVYNRGDANATNRSLADVLRERVSVKDFGAVGKCGSPDAAPTHPLEASCPDETAAFLAAFAWASEPYNQITVHVPPGSYRVDGTIHVVASELERRGAAPRQPHNEHRADRAAWLSRPALWCRPAHQRQPIAARCRQHRAARSVDLRERGVRARERREHPGAGDQLVDHEAAESDGGHPHRGQPRAVL